MIHLLWYNIIDSLTFKCAEIEVQEADRIYRGPVKKISTHGDDVHFELVWCAEYGIGTDKWTAAERSTTVIFKRSDVDRIVGRDDMRRVLLISKDFKGFVVATLFPEGGEKLDPTEVIDLDLDHLPGVPKAELP